MLAPPKMTISLNIHFREKLSMEDVKQIIEILDDRLRELELIIKDMYEDEYMYMSLSVVKETEEVRV